MKQVILIRRDLNMRRGKEIAQGSHASMGFLIEQLRPQMPVGPKAQLDGPMKAHVQLDDATQAWIVHGMGKICLQVASEADLLSYHEKAKAAGLYSFLVKDSGRTEFHGEPTYTACAIGPDTPEKIDAVTGGLSLY